MKLAIKVFFYFILVIGTLLIFTTLLSLLYNMQFWYLKVLDFPRVQVLTGLLISLVLFLVVNKKWRLSAFAFAVGLLSAIVIQATFILPYTILADKSVESIDFSTQKEAHSFSLLLANVWMENRQADQLIQIVESANPDIVLAMETNEWWVEQLRPLRRKYANVVSYPLNNTYGMVLFSKFPLKQTKIMFLKHETVPSIHTHVELPGGSSFVLHAIHPVPPKPSKHPDNIGTDEEALLKVGQMVSQTQLPTVVAGDFNDVAWSRTSRLFNTKGLLGDVRVGRGLYNSFGAQNILLRWPLDHVYVSKEFRVIDIERLPKFGSDHFPILVRLYLHK